MFRGELRFSERLLGKWLSCCPSERAVLQEFILQNRNTVELVASDPVVGGLTEKGVLVPVGNLGTSTVFRLIHPFRNSESAMPFITLETIELPKARRLKR